MNYRIIEQCRYGKISFYIERKVENWYQQFFERYVAPIWETVDDEYGNPLIFKSWAEAKHFLNKKSAPNNYTKIIEYVEV